MIGIEVIEDGDDVSVMSAYRSEAFSSLSRFQLNLEFLKIDIVCVIVTFCHRSDKYSCEKNSQEKKPLNSKQALHRFPFDYPFVRNGKRRSKGEDFRISDRLHWT